MYVKEHSVFPKAVPPLRTEKCTAHLLSFNLCSQLQKIKHLQIRQTENDTCIVSVLQPIQSNPCILQLFFFFKQNYFKCIYFRGLTTIELC